jgi:protein-disulfide isomerase
MQLRNTMRNTVQVLGLAVCLTPFAFSQASPQAAPQALPAAPAAPGTPVPAPDANPFPAADPRDFTADAPTKQTVDDFLKASWGFDPNRMWQIQAIEKTPVAGVSRIVVLVSEKNTPKAQVQPLVFFALPDGKHVIADAVLPFGSHPFEENRKLLAARADGPSQGAASKDLELIEFSDFQCPHCKDAQSTIAKLVADYPSAHFVFQSFPLIRIHSEAFKAASYGVCVAKLSGNDGFFKFADAVFATQDQLTPEASDQTLKAAATKAGADPEKVAACAVTDATKASVNASLNLGDEIGVAATPTLYVNGRGLPLGQIPYETLRQIIDYEAQLDGITLPPRPPAPAAPSLK